MDLPKHYDAKETPTTGIKVKEINERFVKLFVKRNASGFSVDEVERESAKIGKKLKQTEICVGASVKHALYCEAEKSV